MVLELLNFRMPYWVLAYGPFMGNVMIVGSLLACAGAWAKLALPG